MPEAPPSFASRVWHCVTLSALFLVVYGSCNYLTSLRADVGTWYFAWERRIPFVPAFIVPYLSIDLFFVGAFFVVSTRREMATFSRRLLLAYAVGAGFFLLMPLKFGWARPVAGGVFGELCARFWSADLPFNQFPSLHITLRTLLARLYFRHTAGPVRWATAAWFSLIGFSTVLVYQHHVMDVVGGFGLAWLCFYAVGGGPWRTPVTPNRRIGAYYGAAGFVALGIGLAVWPWTAIALWPAAALLIVAAGYLVLGPGVHRKRGGRHGPAAVLMAPVTLGQWLSMRHYARRSPPWSVVTDRLWIGRSLNNREARAAVAAGVSTVIDLTSELPENRVFAGLPGYRPIPVMDLTAPTPAQVAAAMDVIDSAEDGIVYVHCKAGYSRSAAVVGAWLVRSGRCDSAAEAVELLEQVRPGIVVRPEAREAVRKAADGL